MLVEALGSGHSDAVGKARAIIHRLGERGYFDFRDLLTSQG